MHGLESSKLAANIKMSILRESVIEFEMRMEEPPISGNEGKWALTVVLSNLYQSVRPFPVQIFRAN